MVLLVLRYKVVFLMMRDDYTIERFEKDVPLDEIKRNYINFEHTEKLCRMCRCHTSNWTCPPFNQDQISIWEKYDNIKLILLKFNFTSNALQKVFEDEKIMEYSFDLHHGEKTLIEPYLKSLEEELDGCYLTCGPCVNCKECQRLNGKSCVMPDKRKYAMEALGADIIGISKDYFGINLQWIHENKLPEYIIMMVSVLY